MNSIIRVMRVLALPLLLAAMAVSASDTFAQQTDKGGDQRDKLIAAAREIMIASRYCALITVAANGAVQARTMDPFPPGDDLVVWLATNPKSRKVVEIRQQPRVVLYYFDQPSQAYVSLSGVARLVNDPKERARHWKDEWKDFYPDREKGYLLIAVTPEKLEVVNVKKGITGDVKSWAPPTVTIPGRKAKHTQKSADKRH